MRNSVTAQAPSNPSEIFVNLYLRAYIQFKSLILDSQMQKGKIAKENKLETCCLEHQLVLSKATQANKPFQYVSSDLLAVFLDHCQKAAQQQAVATKPLFC